mmetsp:Transcript_17058/g.31047  ORF Transcript_17058/g.31047 Transcript_17058/m.31047 type:complete len:215 (+) Transcript_17058:1813-2457(+)
MSQVLPILLPILHEHLRRAFGSSRSSGTIRLHYVILVIVTVNTRLSRFGTCHHSRDHLLFVPSTQYSQCRTKRQQTCRTFGFWIQKKRIQNSPESLSRDVSHRGHTHGTIVIAVNFGLLGLCKKLRCTAGYIKHVHWIRFDWIWVQNERAIRCTRGRREGSMDGGNPMHWPGGDIGRWFVWIRKRTQNWIQKWIRKWIHYATIIVIFINTIICD